MTVSGGRDGGGRGSHDTHATGSTGTGTSGGRDGKENQRLGALGGADALKISGSVRKRLSLLKLGRKTSRGNGLLVGVDEE
jgi:dedicator of cytokinesis protein 3